jgi:hypothetical protein
VQLSDNPVSLIPGYPPADASKSSRHSRYGDEEGLGGEASEMALLNPNAGGAAGGGVGGFDPAILGEDDDSNIRCVAIVF